MQTPEFKSADFDLLRELVNARLDPMQGWSEEQWSSEKLAEFQGQHPPNTRVVGIVHPNTHQNN